MEHNSLFQNYWYNKRCEWDQKWNIQATLIDIENSYILDVTLN